MHADESAVDLRPGPAHREWARLLGALGSGEAARLAREIEYSCRELGIWQHTDLLPVQPFVVDAASGRGLDELNARLGRLLVSHALDIAAGDFGRLADHTGVSQDTRWFLPAAQPLGRVLGCSRADVLVQTGRPKFLEFNFGACLNGATSTPVLTRALFESGPGIEVRRAHGISTQSVFAARLAWLTDQLPEHGGRVALLGFARDGDEGSLRAFELEAAHHSAQGVPCDFVPFDEVDIDAGGLHWQGVTYSAAVKYFMASERVINDYADRLAALEQSDVALFGSQLAALFTSKALMADLFQRGDLSPTQQRLLDFVPWTARLREGPARRGGAVVDAAEWATTHQESAVLKPCNAFGSRGVILGSATSTGDWEQLLREVVRSDDYVVQEAVAPDPWPLVYWDRQREELTDVTAPVLLGPFRVGERSGGCYTKQPGVNEPARLMRSRDGLSFGCVVTAEQAGTPTVEPGW
ncbi:hypothetical protein CLM62_29565 [Streptomyces sp. SA15]|uniref:hypothetical protein n=1 Tax=Streptomyces sp. SA15 TaxID=934019 RepID=UPI000BAF8B96|nr:hypothetical protein [Streptomyces sp. SA15]PAZ12562.1 hypothetical protein CLM62_29565 [Streptomyces sp. SA15]